MIQRTQQYKQVSTFLSPFLFQPLYNVLFITKPSAFFFCGSAVIETVSFCLLKLKQCAGIQCFEWEINCCLWSPAAVKCGLSSAPRHPFALKLPHKQNVCFRAAVSIKQLQQATLTKTVARHLHQAVDKTFKWPNWSSDYYEHVVFFLHQSTVAHLSILIYDACPGKDHNPPCYWNVFWVCVYSRTSLLWI